MISGMYIHVPFCVQKCGYCSFYSIPFDPSIAGKYIDAVLRECSLYQQKYPLALKTLYIGGGTPTVLSADQLNRFLTDLDKIIHLSGLPEVTIEANPGTLTREKLKVLREQHVGRISLGIQSLNNKILRTLGRIHTAEGARSAYQNIRQAGWENCGIDLIFAVPGQTLSNWKDDLLKTVELKPEHISLYGLTVEKGTPLARSIKAGSLSMPQEESYAAMYEYAIEFLSSRGYRHYEISNFALPGFESRHNSAYWDHSEYLGLGAAAHSFVGRRRWWNIRDVGRYIKKIDSGHLPVENSERLSRRDLLHESIFLSLRKAEGINIPTINREYKIDFFKKYRATMEKLQKAGWIQVTHDTVSLSHQGWLVADAVMAEFM